MEQQEEAATKREHSRSNSRRVRGRSKKEKRTKQGAEEEEAKEGRRSKQGDMSRNKEFFNFSFFVAHLIIVQYPDVLPCMKKAKIEDTRRQLELCNSSRCAENGPLLEKIIALRDGQRRRRRRKRKNKKEERKEEEESQERRKKKMKKEKKKNAFPSAFPALFRSLFLPLDPSWLFLSSFLSLPFLPLSHLLLCLLQSLPIFSATLRIPISFSRSEWRNRLRTSRQYLNPFHDDVITDNDGDSSNISLLLVVLQGFEASFG